MRPSPADRGPPGSNLRCARRDQRVRVRRPPPAVDLLPSLSPLLVCLRDRGKPPFLPILRKPLSSNGRVAATSGPDQPTNGNHLAAFRRSAGLASPAMAGSCTRKESVAALALALGAARSAPAAGRPRRSHRLRRRRGRGLGAAGAGGPEPAGWHRSEEHTSGLQALR